MRGTPKLGRILGVRIRLHYTWAIALVLITAAVVTQFSEAYPIGQRIILGIAAGVLFFITLSIREFILCFMAIIKGIPVKSITLFIFGGVSQITKEATSPSFEVLAAVVGLLSNLVIAGIFYMVYIILANTGNIIIDVLVQWLAFIYFMLALFHFIPGFPLDGGRALRAFLWKATDNYEQVTRIASWTGWSVGLIFTIGGILLMIIEQQWFVGILLAFPGLVLQNAATHSRRQAGKHGSPASQ